MRGGDTETNSCWTVFYLNRHKKLHAKLITYKFAYITCEISVTNNEKYFNICKRVSVLEIFLYPTTTQYIDKTIN